MNQTVQGAVAAVDYDLTKLYVLLIDDCAPMRKILRTVLHALGIKRVTEAADGAEGLKVLEGFFPDLIFVDHEMQPMNGLDFTREVRAGVDGINPFTPVIMISGHTDVARILGARDAGITEYLAKPISAKLIYSRIKSVIDSPRPFIRTETFFGPDRRRRAMPFDGPERRAQPHCYNGPVRMRED